MIWLALLLLAALSLAPLGWSMRRVAVVRGRQDAALALHRAQLTEIDRDLAQGRIGAPEHAIARLEVQRRLLAEAARPDPTGTGSVLPLVVTLAIVPVAALLLYLRSGSPAMPAAPLAARQAAAQREAAQADALLDQLRAKIATLAPESDQARQGYVLVGNLEDTSGDLPAAADAWSRALAIGFDPTLAAQVAEAHSRIDGRVTPESAALFRRALAEAPPDAPWRGVAEQRLADVPKARGSAP